jgi:hypothetical protein
MNYNWSPALKAFRATVLKNVKFLDANGKPDRNWTEYFEFEMRATDTFHPFDTDSELSEALKRIAPYCNYRSLELYWLYKDGRDMMSEAVYSMLTEVGELIEEYFSNKWNFAPGTNLPAKIVMPRDWSPIADKAVPSILKAAKA